MASLSRSSTSFKPNFRGGPWWPLLFLFLAWIAFGLSIYFTTRSMSEAADRLAEESRFYNLVWVEEVTGEISEAQRAERQVALDESRRLLNETRGSNRWARGTFFAGLFTLTVFGILAVYEGSGSDMGGRTEQATRESDEKKGYTGGGVSPLHEDGPQDGGSGSQQGGQGGGSGESGGAGAGGASETEKPSTPRRDPGE